MNKVQSKNQKMAQSTEEILAQFKTAWNGKVAFTRKADQLSENLAAIALQDSLTTPVITGYTAQKKAMKLLMSEAAFAVAAPLSTFARDNKNSVLEAEISFNLTNLSKAQDMIAKNRSQLVTDRAQTNLAGLPDYDITADQLTALQTLITHFDELLALPRAMSNTQKTATANLKTAFKSLSQTLLDLDDLMVQFKTANLTFYQTYTNARQKEKSATRSVSMLGKITDQATGVPLPKVAILVVETGTQHVSGAKGNFRFIGLASGNYTLQISSDGYVSRTIANVGITDGQIARQNIVLVKI